MHASRKSARLYTCLLKEIAGTFRILSLLEVEPDRLSDWADICSMILFLDEGQTTLITPARMLALALYLFLESHLAQTLIA